MSKKTKPVSRLTFVFILAVVISGSILTWFSINNIANLKELTEMQIIEEQRELAARYSASIEKQIKKNTSIYSKEIAPVDQLRKQLIQTTREYNIFFMPFILNGKGQFLFPNFKEFTRHNGHLNSTGRFTSLYGEGEKAEFNEEDLTKAKNKYAQSLRYSKNTTDSLRSLNALGRVSVKQKASAAAIRYYASVLENCSDYSGEKGFSYVYFVIPQLIKIYNGNNAAKVIKLVEAYLSVMSEGAVPLNSYTPEMLGTVRKWSEGNASSHSGKFQNIDHLAEEISKQLQFVSKYRKTGIFTQNGTSQSDQTTPGNGFEVLTYYSNNGPDFLIVKNGSVGSYGFQIDCRKLFEIVQLEDLQKDLGFNYLIALQKGNGTNTAASNWNYVAQASPMFPNWYLNIRLENDKLIEELVRRRSWIYGIASVLLIVAMFLGVFLILRDISREKHLARLRADFISNVTHELKTPLTSIYMFTESLLMRRVKSPVEKEEYLSVIIKESERLKRMINNILEFSKMEKGKANYHPVKADLAETINSAVQDLDYWLENEHFTLHKELEGNLEAEFDPEKMKQAISNLVSNAIKYSLTTREIFIRMHRNSNGIVIEVEDKGIGMPKDKQEKIFDKFYRIEQQENISGTGLGLTVVKEIIEAHNGTIEVTSEPGEGSKFTIHINQ